MIVTGAFLSPIIKSSSVTSRADSAIIGGESRRKNTIKHEILLTILSVISGNTENRFNGSETLIDQRSMPSRYLLNNSSGTQALELILNSKLGFGLSII